MPSGHLDAATFIGLAVTLGVVLVGLIVLRKARQVVRRQRGGAAVRRIAARYRTPRRYHQPVPVRPVMPIPPEAWACTISPGYGSTPFQLGYGPGAAWEATTTGPGLAQRRGTQLYRDPYAGNVHVAHDPWQALYSSMAARGQRPPRDS